ncbi:hypothetical protein [uncultured Clostridium sp.]|uniref:hypothetical protein n=1 Tax=uncultured Clostridium sp. TaxID=59620 RepID=UPI00261840EB|nr:hypothetical protein [uncultured Clostridium sp.]
MKKRYLRAFTDAEKNLFNTKIEKDKIRYSTMSVYSYLLKQFGDAQVEELEVSYRSFLKKYHKHHEKISKDTLANRLSKLIELGLIQLTKIKQKHIYKLVRKVDSFSDSFSDSQNVVETVENTSLESDSEIPKAKSLTRDINNIYISASEADTIAKEIIKELAIKRKIVKKAILLRVKTVYSNINKAGAIPYITKIAINAVEYFNIAATRANKIITANKKNKLIKKEKQMKFKNHEEREYSKDDYEDMYDDPSIAFC